MTDQHFPDTSHYQMYDPNTEDVYPKGQVAELLAERDALRQQVAALTELERLVASGLTIWSVDWIPGICCGRKGEGWRNYDSLADLVKHEREKPPLPVLAPMACAERDTTPLGWSEGGEGK